MTDSFHIPLADAASRIPGAPDDPRFAILRERGSLTVELYRPFRIDRQEPHSRDECYVVVEGSGVFEMGDETVAFGPGDFIFVAAGVPHRFRDFGETMTTWVMFYGPEGGEDA